MSNFQIIQKEDVKELARLFNSVFTYDHITPELMHEKIFDEDFFLEPANIKYVEDGKIKAFATGYVRTYRGKKTGWIKLIAAIDQKSLGSILEKTFERIENILIDHGVELIRFMDSFPNYFRPGIDPRYTSFVSLLHDQGYEKRRDNVNMIAELEGRDFETQAEEEKLQNNDQITIKRAGSDDQEMVIDFMKNEFSVWLSEVRKASDRKPIPLHIAIKNNKVIAFSAHNCNNIGTGWFGPMGTSPEARGKGLGAILLKRCLRDMQSAGLKKSIIPWVGPIGFYFQKVGAEVHRVFWNYQKEIA